MAKDVVWLDVLPSMAGFAASLTKSATVEAAKAGKSSGAAFGQAFGSGADPSAMLDPLKKASAAAEKLVATETQAIAKARAAQREATAKVIEAEDKLAKARQSGDTAKIAAAEERLAGARDRAQGAAAGVEAAEKRLSAAANVRKGAAEKLTTAEADLAKQTEKSGDKASTSSTAFGRFKDSLSNTEKSAGTAAGKIAGYAAGLGLLAAGAKLLGDGWSQAMEGAGASSKLTASLGLDAGQAQTAGKVAGQLYADGFGGSVTETSKAVGAVMSSISGMKDASAPQLAEVTRLAQGFAQAFDVDVAEGARNAAVLIKNGLAPDAVAAFDLMTAGLQKVPEALRGEVMDATQEYSQYFTQLGFTGSEAMGALAAASEGGQYQIDKTGDALKEFSIRATDMSKASGAAYKTLGLDQAEMTRQILAGGDQAKGAFEKIVGGLQGIEDPAAQSQAALALFGTPLEDLGTDKIPSFLEGLTGAKTNLGDVSGAAETAATAISGTVDPVDALKRSLSTTVSEGLTPFVGPAQQMADWAKENPGLMQGVIVILGAFAGALGIAALAQWAMNSAMLANPMTWVILGIGLLIGAIVLLIMNWDNVVKFLGDVFGPMLTNVQNWFGDVGRKAGELWEGMKSGAAGMAEAVGGFFNSLKDKAMTPIRWLADNAINPLLAGIEKVAGFFGLKLELPRIQLASGGQVPEQLQAVRGNMVALADGGMMPGYTPGRDVHRFVSPTAGVLELSGGEPVLRPEWGAVLGSDMIEQMNRAARSGGIAGVKGFMGDHYALGGIWGKPKEQAFADGGIIPNATQGFAGYDPGALAMMKAWASATGRMWSMTGAGGARSYAQQWQLYLNYLAGGNLAADPRKGLGPHMVPAIAMDLSPRPGENAAARALLPAFGLGLTVPGEPWHIAKLGGRGGGVTGAAFDPVQLLKDAIGSIAKVSGAGALGDILNAMPGFLIDKAGEWLKGKFGFDSGGWLEPGATVAVNGTGTPEAILTDSQWSDVSSLARANGAGSSIDKDALREAVRQGVGDALDGAELDLTDRHDVLSERVAARIVRSRKVAV